MAAEEKVFGSEEKRYQELRVEGREPSAPDDFEPDGDEEFEEVEL